MTNNETLLEVEDLRMHFPIRKGVLKRVVRHVKAVDGIELYIREGETVGLVGESGCGKSTTGRCVLRLLQPTTGRVLYRKNGSMTDVLQIRDREEMKAYRREVQIIFQDPFSSLDNRMSVRDTITEPLDVHRIGTRAEQTDRASTLLEKVGLNSYQLNRYPHEFSGGQRQRIGIARALALEPRLIVCDEPVSALDVSVQAQVLNLLQDLQHDFGLTYLFIAHDLSVVEHISERVMVMYLGKIVEVAHSAELYDSPKHPYTEALLMSIPAADPREFVERLPLEGSVPDPSNPPPGCNFNTRCRYAKDVCMQQEPELVAVAAGGGRLAACHFAGELELKGYQDRIRGAVDG
jgi:oligopeptide/dipeptide ABC transporter ATP-binding protein